MCWGSCADLIGLRHITDPLIFSAANTFNWNARTLAENPTVFFE
jgi:hypothetical protein